MFRKKQMLKYTFYTGKFSYEHVFVLQDKLSENSQHENTNSKDDKF